MPLEWCPENKLAGIWQFVRPTATVWEKNCDRAREYSLRTINRNRSRWVKMRGPVEDMNQQK